MFCFTDLVKGMGARSTVVRPHRLCSTSPDRAEKGETRRDGCRSRILQCCFRVRSDSLWAQTPGAAGFSRQHREHEIIDCMVPSYLRYYMVGRYSRISTDP